MLKNKMPSIDETTPLADRFCSQDPFPISEQTPEQKRRYKTFYDENKHSFDDGMSRNIDRDSGFDLPRYNRNQRILNIIITVLVVAIIILVCMA